MGAAIPHDFYGLKLLLDPAMPADAAMLVSRCRFYQPEGTSRGYYRTHVVLLRGGVVSQHYVIEDGPTSSAGR